MKNAHTIKQPTSGGPLNPTKQRSYHEVVEFLDKHWSTTECTEKTVSAMKALDQAFGGIAQKIPSILVTGINGKSLTSHFVSRLLKEEELSVGTCYSPHILTYNERFTIGSETISNKLFCDIANEVINAAEIANIQASSREILIMMALLYFKNNNVDVAVFEVNEITKHHPLTICNPKITAITRISEPDANDNSSAETIKTILSLVKQETKVVSADQNKANLQLMQKLVEEMGATWVMSIRKLAPLAYPFEQLHGRCAALAERIAQVFVEDMVATGTGNSLPNSILAKQRGQRGRPTIEAKRQSELNPKRTVEHFWKEVVNTLPGRFQLLDKEKPMVLLDNASNLDALSNLLLGIRLLHYQRSLKGLIIITDCGNASSNMEEFLRLLRYFFKKTSGQIIVCSVDQIPGENKVLAWNPEKITNDIKSMKIKAHSAKSFQEAFEIATTSNAIDERNGLIVVTGSSSIINKYWQLKGIKKVS